MSVGSAHRFRVAPQVHSRRFGAELVILDLRGGEYFALDEMGARVWNEITRGCAVQEVIENLAREYQVDDARLRSDLEAFADELVAKGLLLPD